MKRVFLIPNVITAFALACGLFVVFKASIADPSRNMFSLLQGSAILIIIAAIADFADGAIARLINAESEFGGVFDALSDAITFGVAPPLLILKSLTGQNLPTLYGFFLILAAMIFSLCGVLRLVRFRVQSKSAQTPKKGHFVGFPIPAAASCALSAALFFVSPFMEESFPLAPETRAMILTLVLVILGYFMVSRWKFPSLKSLHFRVPSFYLIFVTGIIAVLLLYGILDYFPEVYFALSWLYLFISWILSVIAKLLNKETPTMGSHDDE